MSKKGAIWVEESSKWFIGLLIVLVVAVILFGPKKLFAQAKDAVLSLGSGFFPEEKAPQSLAKSGIPQELEVYFDNLASKIKNSETKSDCLIEIGKIPSAKGFNIGLYKNKVQIEKQDTRGLTPPEKIVTIDGFEPCSVIGESASKFYNCYINNYKLGIAECKNAYVGGPGSIDENLKIASFLFKVDNSHSCIIYLDGFDLSRDFIPGCNNVQGFVDDACVEKIKKTYKTC